MEPRRNSGAAGTNSTTGTAIGVAGKRHIQPCEPNASGEVWEIANKEQRMAVYCSGAATEQARTSSGWPISGGNGLYERNWRAHADIRRRGTAARSFQFSLQPRSSAGPDDCQSQPFEIWMASPRCAGLPPMYSTLFLSERKSLPPLSIRPQPMTPCRDNSARP